MSITNHARALFKSPHVEGDNADERWMSGLEFVVDERKSWWRAGGVSEPVIARAGGPFASGGAQTLRQVLKFILFASSQKRCVAS